MFAYRLVRSRQSKTNPRPWPWKVYFKGSKIFPDFDIYFNTFEETFPPGIWLIQDHVENLARINEWLSAQNITDYEIARNHIWFADELTACKCLEAFPEA